MNLADKVRLAGVVGAGGGGFPTHVKLGAKAEIVIANGAECEPLLHKDAVTMEESAAEMVRGIQLAMEAVGAKDGVIGVKAKKKHAVAAVQEASKGTNVRVQLLGDYYPAGDEYDLVYNVTGKLIPPGGIPIAVGAIVNNVETLCNVKHIVAMGGAEFAKLGTPNNTGTRIVSLSGHVKRPGYYEIEVGKATLRELLFDPNFGGGLRDGHSLKAIIPGGSSSKVLKAGEKFKLKKKDAEGKEILVETDMLDLPYDFDSLAQAGTMSGSSAIIVMDDSVDIVKALANLAEFYAHESCGQCTPCREGSLWMNKTLQRLTHGQGRAADADYLGKIADNIPGGRTICAFGEACSWPVQSFLAKFKDDFVAKGKADEERRAKENSESAEPKQLASAHH